jgi:hypothetical protein
LIALNYGSQQLLFLQHAEASFLKSLDKDITVSFPERITIPPQLIEGSPYTWNIANISNMPIAIFVAFKYDVNNP